MEFHSIDGGISWWFSESQEEFEYQFEDCPGS